MLTAVLTTASVEAPNRRLTPLDGRAEVSATGGARSWTIWAGVDAQRDARVSMAQPSGHHMDGLTGQEQCRRVDVPEVRQADPGQRRRRVLEVVTGDQLRQQLRGRVRVRRLPEGGTEDQIRLRPV